MGPEGHLRVVVTVLFVMSASPALAQSPETGEIFEEARRAFDAGLEHLRAKRFDEAVAAFTRSIDLRESSVALYNLAIAERARSRPASALRALERWRAILNPQRTTKEELSAVETMIEELSREIAVIDLRIVDGTSEVSVDGSSVLLDGDRATVRLDPGRHRIEANRPGYRPTVTELEVASGQQSKLDIRAGQTPLDATLTILTTPSDAEIRIDGVARAVGRFAGALAPGAHQIEVGASGHRLESRSLELSPGETRELSIALGAEEPIYREWWLWASLAGVVIAGAVIGVVVANRPPPYDGGTIDETFEALRH